MKFPYKTVKGVLSYLISKSNWIPWVNELAGKLNRYLGMLNVSQKKRELGSHGSSSGTNSHTHKKKTTKEYSAQNLYVERKIVSIIFSLATNAKQAKSITNSISRFLSTALHKGNLGTAWTEFLTQHLLRQVNLSFWPTDN